MQRPGLDLQSSGMLGSLWGTRREASLRRRRRQPEKCFHDGPTRRRRPSPMTLRIRGHFPAFPSCWAASHSKRHMASFRGWFRSAPTLMWVQAPHARVLRARAGEPRAGRAGAPGRVLQRDLARLVVFLHTMVGELVAYYGVQPNGTLVRLNNANPTLADYPQKNIFLQSVSLFPVPWLRADLFETIISGGRFSPTYLLPMPIPVYAQAYLGDWDQLVPGNRRLSRAAVRDPPVGTPVYRRSRCTESPET